MIAIALLLTVVAAASSVKTKGGDSCVFPFNYHGVTYNSCTTIGNSGKYWCATKVPYDSNHWGDCACPTCTGRKCCKFPFTYKGVEYQRCTTEGNGDSYWCSTTSGDYRGCYRSCEGDCPSKEEKKCVFPFTYKGKEYNSCTADGSSTKWCATTDNYPEDRCYMWCPKENWVLQQSNVCFNAVSGSGSFTIGSSPVHGLKLVHTEGSVNCRSGTNWNSNWGCNAVTDDRWSQNNVCIFITDANRNVVFPQNVKSSSGWLAQGWYHLPGYKGMSPYLEFLSPEGDSISAGKELLLWYGEALKNVANGNNEGTSCADIYGLVKE